MLCAYYSVFFLTFFGEIHIFFLFQTSDNDSHQTPEKEKSILVNGKMEF